MRSSGSISPWVYQIEACFEAKKRILRTGLSLTLLIQGEPVSSKISLVSTFAREYLVLMLSGFQPSSPFLHPNVDRTFPLNESLIYKQHVSSSFLSLSLSLSPMHVSSLKQKKKKKGISSNMKEKEGEMLNFRVRTKWDIPQPIRGEIGHQNACDWSLSETLVEMWGDALLFIVSSRVVSLCGAVCRLDDIMKRSGRESWFKTGSKRSENIDTLRKIAGQLHGGQESCQTMATGIPVGPQQ